MFAFPVPKPIYLFIGMFRMLMLVCMGKLFAYLPILLDKFYFTQSSSANLCTYNDEYFENVIFFHKKTGYVLFDDVRYCIWTYF